MADEHQVINLGAAADAGFADRCAIHAGIRLHFNVVLENSRSGLRNPDRLFSRTTLKCSRMPAWIAQRSAKPASAAAPRLMTWCSSAMLRASERTPCFAGRLDSPVQP